MHYYIYLYIIDKYNITNLEEVIMIGDRSYDILGALENGVVAIGVTYGYGSEKELTNAKATYIAHSVEEVFHQISRI